MTLPHSEERERPRPAFLKQLLALLTPYERKRGALVFGMMVVFALLETVGVASVMPFLAVLGNPALVETNPQLAWLYDRGGFEDVNTFLFVLGGGSFVLVIVSAIFRIFQTYALNRYVRMREYSLSARLLQTYLRQPYSFFLNRNSADLSKRILSEVGQVIILVLKPAMELISYALVALILVALLVVVNPGVALVVTVMAGGFYGVIYLGIRGVLRRMGAERVTMNQARFQAADEAFGGIKDLKVLGRENAYLNRFRMPAAHFARHQYWHATLSVAPKYLIEAITFGGISALALFLMGTRGDLGAVLPLLGVYAFAGYRLMPAAQNIFASVSSLRFGGPAVETLYDDMLVNATTSQHKGSESPLHLEREIAFRNVTFRYPNADRPALQNMDLVIPARSSVGFVGSTGAGKTTAVDLLLGLLSPTEGKIIIDGEPMDRVGVRRWQKALGYVPQQIYLADASVAANIAFGVDQNDIDQEAVERAARVARIHDFIANDLPDGYATEVGERGVRLSGGQRQRIGIARALYHDPQVLVFDEATSALDTGTERSIMDALEVLAGEKTLIMIAHRLSTVEGCDRIVVLENGNVVGVGSYAELESVNAVFQGLTAVA